MRRMTPIALIAAVVLAASAALSPSEPAPTCALEGWAGGYHAYCLGGDPSIVVRSMVVPDSTVLYEVGVSEARHGELLRLRPVWRDILTQQTLEMQGAEVWAWRPTAENSRATLRFPVTLPDIDAGLWGPDLVLLERWDIWLPLVEG